MSPGGRERRWTFLGYDQEDAAEWLRIFRDALEYETLQKYVVEDEILWDDSPITRVFNGETKRIMTCINGHTREVPRPWGGDLPIALVNFDGSPLDKQETLQDVLKRKFQEENIESYDRGFIDGRRVRDGYLCPVCNKKKMMAGVEESEWEVKDYNTKEVLSQLPEIITVNVGRFNNDKKNMCR